MNLERITNILHPMYCRALELYQISFPFHEQREAFSLEKILSDNEYHFSLIYNKNTFVGLVLYWESEDFIYIEHLCILPEMRNKQYGRKVLSLLGGKQKTLILEIDPPVDNISKRRKGFYKRCGFIENSFQHIHPPYHKQNHGHNLVIMTYPKQISYNEYSTFNRYLKNKIMNNAFI